MSEFLWPFGRAPPDTVYGTTAGDEAAIAELCNGVEDCEIIPQVDYNPGKHQIAADRVLNLDDWR